MKELCCSSRNIDWSCCLRLVDWVATQWLQQKTRKQPAGVHELSEQYLHVENRDRERPEGDDATNGTERGTDSDFGGLWVSGSANSRKNKKEVIRRIVRVHAISIASFPVRHLRSCS